MLKKFLVVIFSLFLAFPAYAGFNDFVKSIEGVKSAVVSFKQITKIPVAGDEVSLYEGVIYYKKPLKFRWQYTKGSNIYIVSDGEFVETVFPEDGDCQLFKLTKESDLFPLVSLLENPKAFRKYYRVLDKGNVAVVEPKFKDSIFRRIVFFFKGKKLLKIKTVQEDGTEETYLITDFKRNVNLKNRLFRLEKCG